MNNPNPPRIRGYRNPDLESVHRLIQRTIGVCYPAVYPPRAVDFFKTYHSVDKILERSRQGEVLVGEWDGRLIATGALVGGEITGVFVDPDFQRAGIGAAVMTALEQRALDHGLSEVELSVSLPSRGFYERLGYGRFAERSLDVGEGQRLAYWQARKQLVDASASAK
jgi:ribosomal protein S18 acetylase RimI-like enzyme